jgi:hypothetical protein
MVAGLYRRSIQGVFFTERQFEATFILCFMPVYPAALKSRYFATRDVVVWLSAGNGVA